MARSVWLLLLALIPWGVWAQANSTNATVFVYASPITEAFFKNNGAVYEPLRMRWHEYLRQSGIPFREVSRKSLLQGLKPGTLILASAALLDEQERRAIERYADEGNNLIATWASGVRDGTGRWAGYGFLEKLFELKVVGPVGAEENERFLNTFGDGPLTWGLPGGERIFLGEIAEAPIRVQAKHLGGAAVQLDAVSGTTAHQRRAGLFGKG